jgi:hypothetical protein
MIEMNITYNILDFFITIIILISSLFLFSYITKSLKKGKSQKMPESIKRIIGRSGLDTGKNRLIILVKIISYIIYILLIYLAIVFLFRIFPGTKVFSSKLLNILYEPLSAGAEVIYQIILLVLKFTVIGVLAYIIIWLLDKLITLLIVRGINRKAKVKKSTINVIFKVTKIIVIIILASYFIFSIPITHSPYFYWTLIAISSLLIILFSLKIIDIISGLFLPFINNISPGDLIQIKDKIGLILEISHLSVLIETQGGGREQLPARMFLFNHIRIICQDYEKLPLWFTININGDDTKIVDDITKALESIKTFKNFEVSAYILRIDEGKLNIKVNLLLPSPAQFWLVQLNTIDIINKVVKQKKLICRIDTDIGTF